MVVRARRQPAMRRRVVTAAWLVPAREPVEILDRVTVVDGEHVVASRPLPYGARRPAADAALRALGFERVDEWHDAGNGALRAAVRSL